MSWLLRLFESEFFNAWIAISYLFKYTNSVGIQFYLTERLRKQFCLEDIEFFLPQLCHLLIHNEQSCMALESFLIDCCLDSSHFALLMFWNLETYLSDLTGQENSLAYQVCTRAHAKCLKVITDQQAFNSERSNNRNAVISLPHKINPHVPPTILGISGILTCFSSPKISHYMLNMALEQASAPFIPNTPLRRSSFSGSPSFTTTSNNTFPLTPSPQIVQNNISSISPRVQSMRPRRSFSWFSNHRPKLDLRGHVATTPSLEELHQGDAFSFTRYLVKTRTTASSNTDPDSLSRQRSKPVTEYPSNNSSSSNFSKDVLGETWGAVLPSPAITSTGVNDKSKLQNPHYFYSQQTFIAALNQITSRLMLLPKESRQSSLRAELALLNHNLPARVCIPLWCPATKMKPMHHIVCRIVVSECVVLNSAEKVPYLLLVEVLDNVEELKEEDSGFPKNPIDMSDIDVSSLKNIYNTSANNTEVTFADDKSVSASPKMIERKFPEFKLKLLSPVPYPGRAGDLNAYHNMTLNKLISPPPFESDGTTDDFFPRMRTAAVMLAQLNSSDSHVKPAAKQQIKDRILKEMAQLEEHRMNSVIEQRHRFNKRSSSHLNHSTSLPHMKKASEHTNNDTDEEPSINEQLLRSVKEDPSASVFREPWSAKEDRIKRTSPYGHFSSWRLLSVIVKTGSDLRQEQLACQLIREMKTIWKHEEVDIWVYYYRVLVTSINSGLIETISNSISVHSIKKDAYSKNMVPAGKVYSLREYYIREFGPVGSSNFKKAQRNFMKSLAAYCLVTFILSIKDRHNGNILLDNAGHVIHIDFGFMLYNTPGSVGFESAPFKLSQEYIDILDGIDSALYEEWKDLLMKGFLALRKHADKIILLVEMMIKSSRLPCFYGNPESTISALRDRFQLSLTEKQVEQYIDRLILSSHNNMFTRLYDSFQYYSNGIL